MSTKKKKIGHVDRGAGTFVYVDGSGDVYESERSSGGKRRERKKRVKKKNKRS